PDKKALGAEWRQVLDRRLKWRMSGEEVMDQFEARKGHGFLDPDTVERRVRTFLPSALRDFPFKIDMALQDPRPLNPLKMGDRQIYVYDSAARRVSEEPLTEILKYLPGKVAQCRIFAMDHRHDADLAAALRRALNEEPPSIVTNV
ncbi:MAG: hypothetical protein DMD81_27700, partial [Candidatus Rokuibacteriota bacterium]